MEHGFDVRWIVDHVFDRIEPGLPISLVKADLCVHHAVDNAIREIEEGKTCYGHQDDFKPAFGKWFSVDGPDVIKPEFNRIDGSNKEYRVADQYPFIR